VLRVTPEERGFVLAAFCSLIDTALWRMQEKSGGKVLDEGEHAAFVDAWLKRSGKDRSPEVLLQLFDAALAALWAGTKNTLGEVTLTAIAERVVYTTAEKFPVFSCLTVEPAGGIQVHELQQKIGSLHDAELQEGFRFVLVEFLTVLGNLTAEILTPELHSGLARVALPKVLHVEKGMQPHPHESTGAKGGGKRS
jgi:hypothetical protein